MAANNIPYVQDADQWVAYYLDMAEKKVLDPRKGYATSYGSVLYPVEKKNVVYRENEEQTEKTERPVNITMVTPIQQTVEQAKEEVKDQKEDSDTSTPVDLTIKVPAHRKTVSRKRTGIAAAGVTRLKDQLSKSSLRKIGNHGYNTEI